MHMTYSEPEAYLERCQTSTMESFPKIVNSYDYFHNVSFSHEFLLLQVQFLLQKYLSYIKKFGGPGPWVVNSDMSNFTLSTFFMFSL